ncbi:MAG: hypothetical protein Q4G63_04275 [Bacteroidia bacterium]|nr:hypothetical protein [Bacteroidia bacterium]
METKNCNLVYNGHTCTEHYYRYILGYHFTDGVMDVAKTEQCFWFFDVVISAQLKPKVKNEEFQVWVLNRIRDDEFVVFATNGNWVENIEDFEGLTQEENDLNILYKQKIPFSDFKFDTFKVFVSTFDKVIYLPSEH